MKRPEGTDEDTKPTTMDVAPSSASAPVTALSRSSAAPISTMTELVSSTAVEPTSTSTTSIDEYPFVDDSVGFSPSTISNHTPHVSILLSENN